MWSLLGRNLWPLAALPQILAMLIACAVQPAEALPAGAKRPIAVEGHVLIGCAGDCDDYDGYYASPRYYAPRYGVPYGGYYYAPPVYRVVPPPVVLYSPPVVVYRPSSCGRYRYWDGDRCLDARDYRPYVGPRW